MTAKHSTIIGRKNSFIKEFSPPNKIEYIPTARQTTNGFAGNFVCKTFSQIYIRAPPFRFDQPTKSKRTEGIFMSENKYFINVGGKEVAVSKELYDYDKQSKRKITYAEIDRKTERFKADQEKLKAEFIPSLEDSLDRLSEIGEQFAEIDSDFSSHIEMKIELRQALEQLSQNEQELIYRLFFLCQTEREVADELGIFHNAVHKKKIAILAKLHKLLKN